MDCSLNLLYQIHMLYFFFLLRIVLGFFSDPKLGFLFEELRKHKTELQTRNTNSPPSDEQSKVRYPERREKSSIYLLLQSSAIHKHEFNFFKTLQTLLFF